MGLGGFIKAVVGFFTKSDEGVTLTREQAEHVQELVANEKLQISRKTHNLVDNGALEGKTIPIRAIFGQLPRE